jgi:predicted RNase H-like HicB family nuclease
MSAFPYRILAEWSREDECFVARVPALGVATHGDSPEVATHEAIEASTLMLESLRKHHRAIPEPDSAADFSGKVALRLPASLHAEVARLAESDGASINTTLVHLIAKALGRRTSLAK